MKLTVYSCKAIKIFFFSIIALTPFTDFLTERGSSSDFKLFVIGLLKPTSGKILFKGLDLLEKSKEFRKNLGVCLQENCVFSYMSLADHLVFFGLVKRFVISTSSSNS